jgi:anaerobic magnesium-protoporphyrin IX monomethyl ester cyclase
MKVLLINSGNDPEIGGNANRQSYPPLGIISLGTFLENEFGSEVSLLLLDGQVDTNDQMIEQMRLFKPDLVGVSMYCTSINNTLQLVRDAKGLGAFTLLGNDHAAFHYRNLLDQVGEIDFICVSDVGEFTIAALVGALLGKRELSSVPGLAYRQGELQARTPDASSFGGRRSAALDSLGIPNRKLLPERNWSYYLEVFRNQHHKMFDPSLVPGVATINRARGCARSRKPCRYCGIADLTPRGSSPDLFWADVSRARSDVGATYLYEAFDSATSWPTLIRSWREARPSHLGDTRFMMYAQAAETTEESVGLFKDLGVFCVNSGFDSGDSTALKLLKGNQDSLEVNRRAAELWTAAGIEMHVSFVLTGLGNEAETRRSLDATIDFAHWLAKSTTVVSLDSALFYPDRSAPVGSWIWEPERAVTEVEEWGWNFIDLARLRQVSEKWRDEVIIPPLEISADFAWACGVDVDMLLSYDVEVQKISVEHGLNYGRSQGGPRTNLS